MPYNPFPSTPSLQDLTVLHGRILINVYDQETEQRDPRELRPQPWLQTQDDMRAVMDLVDLGLIRSFNGIFFRTQKGKMEKEKLYRK